MNRLLAAHRGVARESSPRYRIAVRILGIVLRFPLADIPVRVHFSFLLIALFSPWPRPIDRVAWTLMVFLAVLLHEVGHALMARYYGAIPVTITLFALGGVTVYPAVAQLTPKRRFVIAAAGSTVGIVTGGLLWLVWNAGVFDGANQVVRVAAASYIFAGLGWGLLNWVPVRPLDGGAMLTSALEIVTPRRAVDIARIVSLLCGVALSIVFYRMGQHFAAVFVLVITAVGMVDERNPRQGGPPDDGGVASTDQDDAAVSDAPRPDRPVRPPSGDDPKWPI